MVVDYSSLDIVTQVGKGGFASVHYGKHDSKAVAIKQLHQKKKEKGNKEAKQPQCLTEFRNEVIIDTC